jgi:hypothetical protein
MHKINKYVIALMVGWVAVTSLGAYLTFVRQPAHLERLEQAERVERLKRAEIEQLIKEEAVSAQAAEEALRKWSARYKIIPATLSSPEVVAYLNSLTPAGFENFDIRLTGRDKRADYSTYTYSVSGRGYFSNLYRFIWRVENSRDLHRINNLSLNHIDLVTVDRGTDRQRLKVMVSFTFTIDAFYGGRDGMSVSEEQVARLLADHGINAPLNLDLPPVPRHLLPDESPAVNPFFPLLSRVIPPNTHNRIDVEAAELISIADGRAFFREGGEFRSVGLGEAVYLGKIISLDPARGQVVARLNKGGIIDDVTLMLHEGDLLHQMRGIMQIAPIGVENE